jgi:hypothetical protein
MIGNDESAALGWKEYRGGEPVRAVLIKVKEGYHLPSWAHYVGAEGGPNEISIQFSTCTVTLKGTGLDQLLRKLIFQRISELFVPKRADRMRQPEDAPGITEIAVDAKRGPRG